MLHGFAIRAPTFTPTTPQLSSLLPAQNKSLMAELEARGSDMPELAKAAVAPRISSSHDGAALRGPVRFCALLGAQAKRRTDREFSIHHLAVVQVFGIEHRRAASAAASNSARAAR